MILHLSNPMTLVICFVVYGHKIAEARFVRPNPVHRGLRKDKNFYKELTDRKDMTKHVAKILNIKFAEISWQNFLTQDKDLVDSNLDCRNLEAEATIIMQSSDRYCIFGIPNQFRYLPTSIRLTKLWRKNTNNNTLVVHNVNNLNLKNRNTIQIENIKLKKISHRVTKKFFYEISDLNKYTTQNQFLLVLPPFGDSQLDFSDRFIEHAIEFAKRQNLSLLIKPHRNDHTNYKKLIKNRIEFNHDYRTLKGIPSELFFNLPGLQQVISVASSSLAFCPTDKLTVLLPKNRKLFRQKYCDQITFLNLCGLPYIRI